MTDIDVAQLRAELTRDEGMRLKPYRCTAGKLTIGVGRNLDDVGINEAEALLLLNTDLAGVFAELDRRWPWWRSMTDARQRALANMAFNLGATRLAGFRGMLAALQAGDWERAAREALDSTWARQVGARADRIAAQIRAG